MDAIKFFSILLWITSSISYGQKSLYPKDTIYLLFDKEKHTKKILKHPKLGKNLYFKNIGVYYDYTQDIDTINICHLKDYKISTIKEIREKHHKWIFGNKRPPANRNEAFITYLIEIFAREEKFVIYPVIWGSG